MPRDYRLYLEDILEAAGKIERYLEGMSLQEFAKDSSSPISRRCRARQGVTDDRLRLDSSSHRLLSAGLPR
jgi:hypothetical protein